jgi:hypothetical protein
MDRLHKSMTGYVKSMSKRNEVEDKEKILPVAYLGQTMMNHGEDFEPDSEFGNCLIGQCLHWLHSMDLADFKQAWEEPTNELPVYKRPTWLMRLRHGWSH